MYLKSIEVQGFKSFAHKFKFDFHKGITGIVGPNGSGKSNVADAVRWVLGEQSARQLRGSSMQDVIFSGTESRKPLSFAAVSITLDNADHRLPIDYEEVTVSRRLYRSGESEYLINGTTCRLKDVHEMFYDTGIGKEGYSIIGQGQIDRILSGKPEERRELFDEAAGIVKFKRRKNLSLKKLEEEQQNLLRVNDILSELEKQVGPLKRQSEKAREYLKKKETLKTCDVNLFLLETQRTQEELERLKQTIALTGDELDETRGAHTRMKQEYEAVEEQMEQIDHAIETSKNQLNETTVLKQELKSQIELLKERIRSAHTRDEQYVRRATVIEEELRVRREQLDDLDAQRKTLHAELAEQTARENDAQAALIAVQSRIASLTDQIDKNNADIMELLENRASTRAKIEKYDTMTEQIRQRKSGLKGLCDGLKAETQKQSEETAAYEEELSEISKEIQALKERQNELETQIETYQKAAGEQAERFKTRQQAYHREDSRLESLKNITERYDGYGNSIRRVMDQKKEEKGLLGVVADLIRVDKKYETAIETALGGSIRNIVTEDEQTAKRMIAYLKKNRFGRATFLPLPNLKNSGLANPQAQKEPGAIGAADGLVKTEERFGGLASHLLGRTLVVDQIDHALAIAKKYHQSIRIVTLEGELINPGGSMTGGAFKNAGNLLSRRREIETLEATVRRLKDEMDETERELERIRTARAACYSEVEAIKEKLQKAYITQNTARINRDQAKLHAEEILRQIEEARKERHELDRKITDIIDNQESINVELDASQTLEQELNDAVAEAQKQLHEKREEEQVRQNQAQEAHLACAGMEQKYEFVVQNVTRIEEEIEKYLEEERGLESSQGDTNTEIREKEEEIQKLSETIENSGELFAEIEAEIEAHKKQKEELTEQHKAFLEERENLSNRINALDKEKFRLESRKEACESKQEERINYMWEEYEVTYNYAKGLRNPKLTDPAKIKKEIQRLQTEIRELGNVNVNAIEEYKELSERYEFLNGQHEDLVKAEETLEGIVEELDAAMRKQFAEQFQQIALEFNKVFRELFGGGKTTLEIPADEDILEAGIRITAQPPGKKLQNIMQLSGGEKALTAIALLFAIQNRKPSPFCLLDEIEAALDDGNIKLFANYLHKLTKNTQFIVITHRRGTMAAADRLYGITMQEKGISTMVSVSMVEDELT